MRKITAVLVGAGARGRQAYASYALGHPDEIQFVAVAEPDEVRRGMFQKEHQIKDEMSFADWRELLDRPRLADAILICTQDNMHFEPAIEALKKGYHILLEKPISNNLQECVAIGEYAQKYPQVFSVCHVLRYTKFFSTIKQLLDSGRIGKLVSIQHNENVAFWHQAHSFVRGNWRNSDESSPMILAKCCHDMDILLWLTGSSCRRISSFGSLAFFNPGNAPQGAPKRCLDGCPVINECAYAAPRIYLTENTGWPTSVISNDTSREAREKALREGPYGRCVFYCDNNVVDHQVVNIEFENGVTAAFTMCAFTKDCCRTIKLMGTQGEIRASDKSNEIAISDFKTGTTEVIDIERSEYGHGGGDYGIMHDFIKLVAENDGKKGLTAIDFSVQSHLMAFAAEQSRIEGKIIDLNEFGNAMQLPKD